MTETMSGSSPVYNFQHNHELELTDQTRLMLQKEQLKFIVFDESIQANGNSDNDIIGTA